MALKKTGYTEKTSNNYLVDAAVVYTGVTFDEIDSTFTGTLHGATSGGVSVLIEQTYRDIEVDGTSHTRIKGNKVLESAIATATVNLKEITAESIKQSLNGAIADTAENAPAGYKEITTKRYVEDTDYIANMAIVGKLSGSQEPVIIILDNVLSTGGMEIATEDNGEAVIEQTFEAHATHEQLEADEFPWRILYPTVA